MPSGITSDIYEGKPVTLRSYILTNARQFGALVLMRDDDMHAPIPTEFEPSPWRQEWLDKSRAELTHLESASEEELRAEQQKEIDENTTNWYDSRDSNRALKARYEDMKRKVEAWEPPTPDHVRLKEHSIQQLDQSIEYDCRTADYDKPEDDPYSGIKADESFEDWLARKKAQARKSIERDLEEIEQEKQRAKERSEWVRALVDSLPPETDDDIIKIKEKQTA